MKNLTKGIVAVGTAVAGVTGVTIAALIGQTNRNTAAIVRLSNEKYDLLHELNMAKLDVEYQGRTIDRERKENDKLGKRVFALEMDNITLKSAAKRAAKDDFIKPSFYTDRKKEEEITAAELKQANEESMNDIILENRIEQLEEQDAEQAAAAKTENDKAFEEMQKDLEELEIWSKPLVVEQ